MAEFLTMEEAKSKFGSKSRTNAGLTLGTALAAFAGNNGGCGCGNGGGILGNLFGGNNNCCAMQAAENAKTLAMAQGQQADNLSWANRVQSMQDDIDLSTSLPVKGHCAYSVFDVRVTPAPAPTAAIASVAKSK